MKSYLFTCLNCGTQMAFTENQAGVEGPCGGCGMIVQAPLPFKSNTIPVGQSESESEETSKRKKRGEPTPGKLISPQGNYVTLIGETIRFGANPRSDVIVAESYGTSEEHFQLSEEGDQHILINLAPNENQTRVNAMAVCERPLRDNDVIFAGQLRLTYRAPTIRQEEEKARKNNRQRYARAAVIGATGLLLAFIVSEAFKSVEPAKKKPKLPPRPKLVMPAKPPPRQPARPVQRVPAPISHPAPGYVSAPDGYHPVAGVPAYPQAGPGYVPASAYQNLPYTMIELPDRRMAQNVRRTYTTPSSFAHVTVYEESVVNHYEGVLVDAYLRNGHRHWKWDKEAITALTLFARIYASEGTSFSRVDFEEMKAAVSHCIRSGCRDAAILHAKDRIRSTEFALTGGARRDSGPSLSLDEIAIAAYPAEVRAPSYLHKMRADGVDSGDSGQSLMKKLIQSTAEWDVDSSDPYLSTVYWDHVEEAALTAVEISEGNSKQVVSRFVTAFKAHGAPQQVRDIFTVAIPVWLAWQDTLSAKNGEPAPEPDFSQLGIAKLKLDELWDAGMRTPIVTELMLKISLLAGDRELMDLWFERAITTNPEDPTPYRLKAEFLSPGRHGDVEELTAYADSLMEQMDTPNLPWLGLEIYSKINQALDGDFGKRPEIWTRVEGTFEKFFKRYPDAHYRKAQGAAIAWELGHPTEAREQLMETGLDYAAFTMNIQLKDGELSPHEQIMKEAEEAEFRVRLEGAIMSGLSEQ